MGRFTLDCKVQRDLDVYGIIIFEIKRENLTRIHLGGDIFINFVKRQCVL